MDLNHDKQIQSLLCYRYTTRQWSMEKPTDCEIAQERAVIQDFVFSGRYASEENCTDSETPPNLG
jgi:hypothetical protein